MNPPKVCEHCGAKMVEYGHGFSALLAEGLAAIAVVNGPINLKKLGLTRNQWDNFQKLRYWGLVEQVTVDGRRQNGVWQVTPKGRDFVSDKIKINRKVWTYRGETVRFSGPEILFSDPHPKKPQQRLDYAEEAQT